MTRIHTSTPNSAEARISPGQKFSCIVLHFIHWSDTFKSPLHLGNGIWVSTQSPFQLTPRWIRAIGDLQTQRISTSNCFLVCTQDSQTPNIENHENEYLVQQVNHLLFGILLQGIPWHVNGWIFTGGNVSGEIIIQTMGDLPQYYHSHPSTRVLVDEYKCQVAKQIIDSFKYFGTSSEFSRLGRGMGALVRGMQERMPGDRIHEYVRSLDAVIKPKRGSTTNAFVHRCKNFTLGNQNNRKILEECYEIRSKVEHMHIPETALAHLSPSEQGNTLLQRLRQIEELAFDVYLRIHTKTSLRSIFKDDASIESFWTKRDSEIINAWGYQLDLEKISCKILNNKVTTK